MGCCSSINAANTPAKASPKIPKPIPQSVLPPSPSPGQLRPQMHSANAKIDEKMRIDTPMPTEENYKSPGKEEDLIGGGQGLNQSKANANRGQSTGKKPGKN